MEWSGVMPAITTKFSNDDMLKECYNYYLKTNALGK